MIFVNFQTYFCANFTIYFPVPQWGLSRSRGIIKDWPLQMPYTMPCTCRLVELCLSERPTNIWNARRTCGRHVSALFSIVCTFEAVAISEGPPKLILNSNIDITCLPITYFAVDKSFWNFTQSTEVVLLCSVQNHQTIVIVKCTLWTNEVPRDLGSRKGISYVAEAPCLGLFWRMYCLSWIVVYINVYWKSWLHIRDACP